MKSSLVGEDQILLLAHLIDLLQNQPGTDELGEVGKIFEKKLNMAFPAVPIFYYNRLDGRGPLSIWDGFVEHFNVMKWWASIDKPLEINDPHQ